MKLSELLFEGEYVSSHQPSEIDIGTICHNTRQALCGNLFVCIKGIHYDGHCFGEYIGEQGASAIIVEEGCSFHTAPHVPVFAVKDSRATFATLWHRFCGSPGDQLKIIGITGTNGKTSTAYMIHKMLCEAKVNSAFIGTIGCYMKETPLSIPFTEEQNQRLDTMTTPDPDLLYPLMQKMVEEGATHLVMEVSSHALALKKCHPLTFEVSLFTNLSSEHMDFHSSIEEYAQTKSILFKKSNIGIFNADAQTADIIMAQASCQVLTCSAVHGGDFFASRIQNNGMNGISYILNSNYGRLSISLQIPGTFSVYNSMLALAAALTLGIKPFVVRKTLSDLKGVRGRMEKVDVGQADFAVLIDYAHTEAAMRHLLTTVRSFSTGKERIVALFGCGGDRDATKRAAMGRCAYELADFSIITTDNSRTENPAHIIMDILKGYPSSDNRIVILNRKKAIEYAIATAQPHDIILLIGKGHETYELTDGEKKPFDERKIVAQAIKCKDSTHTNIHSDEN